MPLGITQEEIIANILCFVSRLSFSYYLAKLKKNGSGSKRFIDELIFPVQNKKNNQQVNI